MAMIKGAIIEYGSSFLGPVPNIVIFQFNPETQTRNISIPERPTGAAGRETTQAGETPVERITLTAQFHAADQLEAGEFLAEKVGIGSQLAALEKMVYPTNELVKLIGKALDAIGDAIGGGNTDPPTQPIPRQQYPRLLFIWGSNRIFPVIIESMTINEQLYDSSLNPIQAEVTLGLAIPSLESFKCTDDPIGKGALEYSNLNKETQAIANLAKTAPAAAELVANLLVDVISF